MSRPVDIATLPKQALQSYLDSLLQEATEAAEPSVSLPIAAPLDDGDDFAAAVLEEQARDAQVQPVIALKPTPEPEPEPLAAPPMQAQPVAAGALRAVTALESRPAWANDPFECLLFDVAGLTLAVPLVCLGSIYPLQGQELTPLFGQPNWFLGLLPTPTGNLKVLDTARWVMPDRYRDEYQLGLQFVISVQGYDWGLAVHQVSRSLLLDPDQIKWRPQRGQRPWLAGTVIEHMCALLDVAELAELIDSGAVKYMQAAAPVSKAAGKPKR